MKTLITFSLILTSSLLQAETLRDRVHSVEDGLIKFENGRVGIMKDRSADIGTQDVIEVELDEKSNVLSFKKLSTPMGLLSRNMFFLPEEEPTPIVVEEFLPSIVQGIQEANNIFNRSNANYKRISECSDRAHVWAHDEFKRNGTQSEKVFVFFTASYINSVGFKWWFHVAPLYTVHDQGTIKKLVMDYRYTDRPMTVKEWTDQFVFTKRDCKVTDRFSEYDVNPQTENCYLMFESMHYRLPADLAAKEKGQLKTSTSESELRSSFNYAFNK